MLSHLIAPAADDLAQVVECLHNVWGDLGLVPVLNNLGKGMVAHVCNPSI